MIATIRPAEIVPEVVPMTVAALRLLDEQNFFVNDNNRHELIEGVLVMVPPPSTSHQFSESRVLKALMKSLMSADRKSTRLNSSHRNTSRMPSSA